MALPFRLVVGHLYPNHLNMYGDRGNVLALLQRALWRGFQASVLPIHPGQPFDPNLPDILFMGGGQDSQQIKICEDLHHTQAQAIQQALARGCVMLGICGGYQLMGHYYQPHQGEKLPGLSLIDAYTVAGLKRMIGNIVVERPDGTTIVGFENHSGQTFLGSSVSPLGKVRHGGGNNGQDQTEGAIHNNLYGTYLHGSLLPKNPKLTDELLLKAFQARYGDAIELPPLNNNLETQAHRVALTLH